MVSEEQCGTTKKQKSVLGISVWWPSSGNNSVLIALNKEGGFCYLQFLPSTAWVPTGANASGVLVDFADEIGLDEGVL